MICMTIVNYGMTDFTVQILQVIYFVIRCEAKHSKVPLEIFKCA